MARLVLITHRYDRPFRRRLFGGPRSNYMICDMLEEMRRRGHSWTVAPGPMERIDGDLAILHVDTTVTDPDYVAFGARFPACLNLSVTDISKRRISEALVAAPEDWDGPVIVKSNLNCGGSPEARLNRQARRLGRPTPYPGTTTVGDYRIFPRASDVPRDVFDDPALVVERYLAETEADGFAMRCWVFCGSYDFCGRFFSKSPLIKSANIFRNEPAEIPDDLRRRREALGFDYGKFDFAVHDGKSYLLDANKTPGRLTSSEWASIQGLTDGLERIVQERLAG